MSYTKHILKDFHCNYFNAEENNAEKMLLSCINFEKTNITNNNISEGTINGSSLIEAFSSDMSKMGGVSYVPNGECPDGYSSDGKACIKVCNNCNYNDKNGYFGRSYFQSNNICGQYGTFNGVTDNGYINCKTNY